MSNKRKNNKHQMNSGLFVLCIVIAVVLAGIFLFTDFGESFLSDTLETFENQEAPADLSDSSYTDSDGDNYGGETESNDTSGTALDDASEPVDSAGNSAEDFGDSARTLSAEGFNRVMPRDDALTVIVLDVGQGNSVFVRTPSGKTMLVDTGEYEYWDALNGYLKKLGVTKIDALVGTHPHSDHIGSMQSVIKNYEIGEIYMPRVEHTTSTYTNLLKAIRDRGLKVNGTKGGNGKSIPLGDDVKISILGPLSDEYSNLNNYSIVLKIEYAGHSMLITADAEKLVENEILKYYDAEILKSDIFLCGHHGSNTSNSAAFLKAVDPDASIISLGADNDYGHPHKEVVERLNERGIPFYRTDELGSIAVYFLANRIEMTSVESNRVEVISQR